MSRSAGERRWAQTQTPEGESDVEQKANCLSKAG